MTASSRGAFVAPGVRRHAGGRRRHASGSRFRRPARSRGSSRSSARMVSTEQAGLDIVTTRARHAGSRQDRAARRLRRRHRVRLAVGVARAPRSAASSCSIPTRARSAPSWWRPPRRSESARRSQGHVARRRGRPDRQELAAAAGRDEAGRHRPEDAGAAIAYGAPALLAEKTLRGEFDATLNYWNFCAALEAKGCGALAGIEDILPQLGVKGSVGDDRLRVRRGVGREEPRRGRALPRRDPQGQGHSGGLRRRMAADRAARRHHRGRRR